VIVRPVANYGMPNHLRVTIGLPAENAASSRRWPRFWLVADVTAGHLLRL
jgi:histidinol-phosphate/aromatic aminotransferase/cobyric acid decarboxylase-like protein